VTPASLASPVVITSGSLVFLVMTTLGRLYGGEYTGESLFSGGEHTGESIINTNNYRNIRQNSKSFLGISNGTRRSYFMKKGDKKCHNTVPLNASALHFRRSREH
jgi:hypothetical protein